MKLTVPAHTTISIPSKLISKVDKQVFIENPSSKPKTLEYQEDLDGCHPKITIKMLS